MDGYIIQYRAETYNDLLKLTNTLLGRVVRVEQKDGIRHYYYKGLLHNIAYYKLSNGCYFITAIDNHITSLDNIKITKAKINIKKKDLITGNKYFQNKYEGIKVNNLGRNN